MELYEILEMEVIVFESEDVIMKSLETTTPEIDE